jgi:hypothetical protein
MVRGKIGDESKRPTKSIPASLGNQCSGHSSALLNMAVGQMCFSVVPFPGALPLAMLKEAFGQRTALCQWAPKNRHQWPRQHQPPEANA